jgi:hypothetical protein
MYEQLKAVPEKTALQERLTLLVHLKKKQIRVREMELFAIGMATGENAKALEGLMDGYRKMNFPGVKEKKAAAQDSQLERAKAMLAQEAKNVFVVRPLQKGEGLPGGDKMLPPQMARLHSRQISEEEQARLKQARGVRRMLKGANRLRRKKPK